MNLSIKLFALRHGESEANQKSLIVSHPRDGLTGYGLTPLGCQQVKAQVNSAVENGMITAGTLIYSSPFRRSVETTVLSNGIIRAGLVRYDARLRERFFGSWDLTSTDNYAGIWAKELQDPDFLDDGRESVTELSARMLDLVRELNKAHPGASILLVTHADPALILQAALSGSELGSHSLIAPLGLGELRRVGELTA